MFSFFFVQTHLLALEEAFSVTVGKVQRESHYARSVLHSLNDAIQFSSAWTLWREDITGLRSSSTTILHSHRSPNKHELRCRNVGSGYKGAVVFNIALQEFPES